MDVQAQAFILLITITITIRREIHHTGSGNSLYGNTIENV